MKRLTLPYQNKTLTTKQNLMLTTSVFKIAGEQILPVSPYEKLQGINFTKIDIEQQSFMPLPYGVKQHHK